MSKNIISIDPSMHSTGVAVFADEDLYFTKKIAVNKKVTGFNALSEMSNSVKSFISCVLEDMVIDFIVIEEQVHRDNDRMAMDDFVKMASISYVIGCNFSFLPICFVQPSTWKKTIPKKIHTKRIYERELERGTKVSLIADMQPDIMDAVGIGRWWYANKSKG